MRHHSLRPLTAVVVLGIAVAFVVSLTPTAASQERKKLSWTSKAENTKFTGHPILEIVDVPGHAIRSFEIRRTYPDDPPIVEGLKVVEEIARGFNDQVQGNGRAWGYTFWRMENGDLMYSEWQNTSQAVVTPTAAGRRPWLVRMSQRAALASYVE